MSNGFDSQNLPKSATPCGMDFYRPTYLPKCYHAKAHRSLAKQQSANERAAATIAAHNEQVKRLQSNVGSNGGYVPQGHERLVQVSARSELYTDVEAPEITQQAVRLAETAEQRRLETIRPRMNRIAQREVNLEAAEEHLQRAENAADAQMMHELTQAVAQRSQNASVDAATAEKQKYADEYKRGNEEAYAYVEALQNSVRGYEDTSKATIEALRQQNNREAARHSFMTPY